MARPLLHDEAGQSAPISVALLLAITVIGTISVVAFGAVALTDTEQRSQVEQSEHVMTQFDSQASQVALGSSNSQTLPVGRTGGQFRVEPNAGTLKVVHVNFTGNTPGDGNQLPDGGPNDDDALLYETTLGAVVYENGDSTLAYQGGGVWRITGDGNSTMVSPPEFHYRGSTLTFPVIRVNQAAGGADGGAGRPRLTVAQEGQPRDMYPNVSRGYPDVDGDGDGFADAANPYGGMGDDGDGDGGTFLNPATDGTAIVIVQSDYYLAWGQYFDARTDGDIRYDHANEEVTVELVSTGFTGAFQMPGDGGSIGVRGVQDHSVSEFTINLADPPSDSADLNNMQWSMYAESEDRQFEMHLRDSANNDTAGTDCKERDVSLTIYYSPSDGDADRDDTYHGWYSPDAFTTQCIDRDGDGSDDEELLTVDFIDADGDDPTLTYQEINQLTHFDNPKGDLADPATFDEHGSEVAWEDPKKEYSDGDTETSDRVLNHYFSLLGDGIDLTVDDKNSDSVYESDSSGVIQYEGGDKFITYIHLTENDVTVTID